MDLIISGMALSYQWWPSITHFEESLPEKRESSPAMVEQAGEVIYQALSDARVQDGSKLSIIYDPDQIDLGHYLPLIKEDFAPLDQEKPISPSLFAKIKQASHLIQQDPDRQVVICELSLYGSAAIVLSSPDKKGAACVRLKSAGIPGLEPSLADYVVITKTAAPHQEKSAALLRDLFQDRPDRHPIALGSCSTVKSQSPEIVTFIHAVLSIKHKIIPGCSTDNDPITARLSGIPINTTKEFRPWLSRGPGFNRSSLLLYQNQEVNALEYIVLEEYEGSEEPLSVRFVSGSDPYLFPVSGDSEEEILNNLFSLE